MSSLLRRRLSLLLIVLAAGGTGALAATTAGAQTTSAVAINTKDGSSVFKLAFAIRRVTGDVVDATNAAVAYASCTECQTVAISIQILLVAGDPSVVSPTNVALAINQDCTLCDTLATAYQFALGYETVPRFTPEGQRQVHDIFKALQDLKKSDLSGPELQARVDELMDRLAGVLATQLVTRRPTPADERDDKRDGGDETSTQTTTTTPPSTTTTPTQTTPATSTTTTPASTTPTETTPAQTTTTPPPTTTTTTTP